MNLELRSIVEAGNLEKERLTLRAKTDLDLGDYLVAQTGFAEGHPTTELSHTIWFQFKKIKKGDLVIIYSKSGIESERTLKAGNTAHFFYLGLDDCIWDDPTSAALVLHAPTWESKPADKLRG